MKMKSFIASLGLLALTSLVAVSAQAEEMNVDALLQLVKEGQVRDYNEFNQRIEKFRVDKAGQEALLAQARADRARLESESASKEAEFADNEARLADAQDRLTTRLGSLKELFGVLQQVSGDTRSLFQDSVVSAEVPGRDAFLAALITKAGSSSELPSMEELEQLWFEMQREMTYSGRVSKFTTDVVMPSGTTAKKEVVRVGGFNLVADGKYLSFDFETQKVQELPSQPSGRYTDAIADLESATGAGLTGFWVDPSRGQLLRILGQSAGLQDRIEQGGTVGYVIIVLGIIGLLIAAVRIVALTLETGRVKKQMKTDVASDDNSLGRVMKVYNNYKAVDIETLELHLAEAISAEIPKLTKGISWIKIVSVVSPLLGLLGTVTGMIDVFETLSLFGSGDPKLMANGISQALVTTVQGLVVAIPCVFSFTMASNRSRALIVILEERATGILARKSEELAGLKQAA